ncbi:unnamed protein product [Sphenostylis stenocarpa]|uniref:Uncharacterized protein n=1 Tax=Sphenostylis stenocarpa TaxID=92480 RepID=A0AA86VHV2_9FABA|nr:unnamed protein product [Sphenostylis stenocarpa]
MCGVQGVSDLVKEKWVFVGRVRRGEEPSGGEENQNECDYVSVGKNGLGLRWQRRGRRWDFGDEDSCKRWCGEKE